MTRDLLLRDVTAADVAIFFDQQVDPAANRMAASTTRDPTDREAFFARWRRTLEDAGVSKRTILSENRVAGYIASFERLGKREVSYWIGPRYWGMGVATAALTAFLRELTTRPLYARAAKDNVASLRVLAKCGFAITGEDKFFSSARGEDVEELVLELR